MNIDDAIFRCKSEKNELPKIINSDAGLYTTEDLNVIGIPSWNRINTNNNKRKVYLVISTYRGISSDAIHYYGKFVIDGVYTATLDDLDKPRNLSSEDKKNHPLYSYNYEMIIKRPITIAEIKSNPDKWYAYNVGDLTERYENIDELISDAKDIFKLRFIGDWDFFIQYPMGKKVKI